MPSTGIEEVAFAAAKSAGVAFAMMRSTSCATKFVATVELFSPPTWNLNSTDFPSFSKASSRASLKPSVARSSES